MQLCPSIVREPWGFGEAECGDNAKLIASVADTLHKTPLVLEDLEQAQALADRDEHLVVPGRGECCADGHRAREIRAGQRGRDALAVLLVPLPLGDKKD